MHYNIIFSKDFKKKFDKFDDAYKSKVKKSFYLMSLGLFSWLDVKELQPKWHNMYRFRVGKYRIIYEKQDDIFMIFVLEMGSRWDIYK